MGQVIRGGEQFETHIQADHRGQLLKQGPDSGAIDAFGRARVSEPFTMFDSTLRFDKRADQWYEISGGSGSINYLANECSLELKTTTASGDTVLRRTKRNISYQPGKSLQIMQSFCGGTLAPGLIQEIGYFDSNNGVMLRASGTTVQFVIRSKDTGSIVEDVIDQASWNIDAFPEFIFNKTNIFITDLEWLGVGRVRCGFVLDGEIKWCHEFNHANNETAVYMSTATLPLSYRIKNDSVLAFGAALKQICCTAICEGGYEPVGPIYAGGAGVNGVQSITTETMFAAIRMASGRTDNVIIPSQIDVAGDGNSIAEWRLYLNPTISGTWMAASNGRGNVEVMNTGTISGGTIIETGLLSGKGSAIFSPEGALALSLGKKADGSSDVLALTIQCDTSMKVTGKIGWREVF